ncbi:HAD-IC family P-type ATPase [Phenylobacterium sp. J367]|uniref:HAD-IC family P-type ATPase n=1 Tax=Phenylobacterium sp. J367 TaxID=2898435 RepID=UPI002150A390|nr:HAD-IC family P-type ATPase [Phenylobacterium sp. J367]MCR5881048.1 HAD-IC family P-type ATPase [Phenylobacterium sp. J367]
MWFGFEGDTKIRFRFSDRLRADAAGTVAALRARGLTVEVLSGDVAGPVAAAAEAAGIDAWRAGLTPQDKAAAIDALAAQGRRVLMVGDGLNDAAALARAHAAMAPGTALEASQNAADLVFSGEGSRPSRPPSTSPRRRGAGRWRISPSRRSTTWSPARRPCSAW